MQNPMTSTSLQAARTWSLSRSPSSVRGRCRPGVSSTTSWAPGRCTMPRTTRRVVRGIVHRPGAQLVVLDTPGLHRPRTLLGERLNDQVRAAWSEVDVIGFCIPADEPVGAGDTYIARELAQ